MRLETKRLFRPDIRKFRLKIKIPVASAHNLRYLRTMEENSVATRANVKISAGLKFVLSGPLSRIVVTRLGGGLISQPFVQIITASILRHRGPLIVLGSHPFAGAFLHNTQGYHFASHSSLLMGYSHPIIRRATSENRFVQNYDGYSPPSLANKVPCIPSLLHSTQYGLTTFFRDLQELCNGWATSKWSPH